METPKKERVIVYIDGFNLYFGMKESQFNRYFWLDIQKLVINLLLPKQSLVTIKYFTSLVTNKVEKRLRQRKYIDAVKTLENVEIFYGSFLNQQARCEMCGNDYVQHCEKMTDVNIAMHMLCDFHEDKFDMAMVISGDTDLLPPIRYINEKSNTKRVFVAFPPKRSNEEVRKYAKGSMTIGRKTLADSQFPQTIKIEGQSPIVKPAEWPNS